MWVGWTRQRVTHVTCLLTYLLTYLPTYLPTYFLPEVREFTMSLTLPTYLRDGPGLPQSDQRHEVAARHAGRQRGEPCDLRVRGAWIGLGLGLGLG